MPHHCYGHCSSSKVPTARYIGTHRRHGAYVRGPCIPCPNVSEAQRGGRTTACWAATGHRSRRRFADWQSWRQPPCCAFQVSALQPASTIDSLRIACFMPAAKRGFERSSVSRTAEGEEHPLALRSPPSACDHTSTYPARCSCIIVPCLLTPPASSQGVSVAPPPPYCSSPAQAPVPPTTCARAAAGLLLGAASFSSPVLSVVVRPGRSSPPPTTLLQPPGQLRCSLPSAATLGASGPREPLTPVPIRRRLFVPAAASARSRRSHTPTHRLHWDRGICGWFTCPTGLERSRTGAQRVKRTED